MVTRPTRRNRRIWTVGLAAVFVLGLPAPALAGPIPTPAGPIPTPAGPIPMPAGPIPMPAGGPSTSADIAAI